MGNLLAGLGDAAGARRHRDRGFAGHSLTVLPYRGEGAADFRPAPGLRAAAATFRQAQFSTTALSRRQCWSPNITMPKWRCRPTISSSTASATPISAAKGLRRPVRCWREPERPVINHPAARAANRTRRECRPPARPAECHHAADAKALAPRAGRRLCRRNRRRERLFFSAAGARAGLPHRPAFCARRDAARVSRRGRKLPRRRCVADRATRRARQRGTLSQDPRHDRRPQNLSAAFGDIAHLEGSLFPRRHGAIRKKTAARTANSSTTWRA